MVLLDNRTTPPGVFSAKSAGWRFAGELLRQTADPGSGPICAIFLALHPANTPPRLMRLMSPDPRGPILTKAKQQLRREARAVRKAHVASLPQATRALLFLRPPAPLLVLMPEGATIGLYHAMGDEAPTQRYARWLYENGRTIALPWFGAADDAMSFRQWSDPFDDGTLEQGPHRALQPSPGSPLAEPDALIVPLLGFTAAGQRLGQGGGHYDRWLADHPGVSAIGLAWDCQLMENLPHEAHDQPLSAVVTPTRFYEGTRHAQ